MTAKKMSPLKFLATLHREMKEPTQVVPKSKKVVALNPEGTEGTESIEETSLAKKEKLEIPIKVKPAKPKVLKTKVLKPEVLKANPLNIRDFSFVFNLNFNLDSQAIGDVVEKSAKIMTGLAAGAAVLGTALVFGKNPKDIQPSLKVLLPDLTRTRIPKDPRTKSA
jgi:hypothetical protein